MKFAVIVIVVLLVIAAVVAGAAFLRARRRASAAEAGARERAYRPRDPFSSADADAVRGDPRRLRPGDLIEIDGETYAVRGTLRLTEGSYTWTENFIDTGLGQKVWLSVEDDPDLEVVLWNEVRGVAARPGPASIEVDGRSYSSVESGEASFTSVGTTGLDAGGTVRYHDYEDGDARFSFEDFGGGWEASRGRLLAHTDFRIYPANPAPE